MPLGRISAWRLKMIQRLIADYGAYCHYCPTPVRLRVAFTEHSPTDATLDHKIPRAKGGTNDYENLLLSCWSCNNAKGDQDYDEFKRDRRSRHVKERERLRAARPKQLARAKNTPWHHPRVKIGNGTMAAAIQRGDIDEAGNRRPSPVGVPTWIDWPWLCELIAPRVRDVGFGPWAKASHSPSPPGLKMVMRGGYWMTK